MNEEAIFSEAIEKNSAAARAAFLNDACGDDLELRRRVEQLLKEHDHPDALFDEPATAEFVNGVAHDGIPERLGDFEIVREIGRGGMGVVYEARQVTLNRPVALKVLSYGLSSTAVLRFQREAEAAARLHHTNIVPIYSTGQQNRLHYYVMELIDAPSLDKVLDQLRAERASDNGVNGKQMSDGGDGDQDSAAVARSGDRPQGGESLKETTSAHGSSIIAEAGSLSSARGAAYFDAVARMMAEVADALAHAHEEGVIHRDVKPSNLLLSKQGRLSVNDFGLARMLEQPGMTVTGEFAGSPLYMSPEQVTAGREPIDHRTDIYSLGATLYEMLTLHPPFEKKRRDQIFWQVLHEEPTAPRKIDRRIHMDLQTICLKAMEKSPKRRYQTAEKMADDLRRYVNRHAISARRIGPVGKAVRWCRRKPAISALAAALLLAVMLGIAAFAWQGRDRSNYEQFLRQVSELASLIQSDQRVDALRILRQVPAEYHREAEYVSLLEHFNYPMEIRTHPPGATVFIRQHDRPDQEWYELGPAPLSVRLPESCYLHFRITHGEAETTGLFTDTWPYPDGLDFYLPKSPGMVHVDLAHSSLGDSHQLIYFGLYRSLPILPYSIDRTEVTNAQFQKFVDAGGYEDPQHWIDDLGEDWQKVVNTFQDDTEESGPAGWRMGKHLPGKENHPVRGISWYEAQAYARFAGKRLPTLFHWYRAARIKSRDDAVASSSNMQDRHPGPVEVGILNGIGPYGTYDMAGNVREWCLNGDGAGKRYALGGSWLTAPAYFMMPTSLPPESRLHDVGFRCAKYEVDGLDKRLLAQMPNDVRDFLSEHEARRQMVPTLEPLRGQFTYDEKREWEHKIVDETQLPDGARCLTVSFAAGYGPPEERITAYLMLPDENLFQSPFQTVIAGPHNGSKLWKPLSAEDAAAEKIPSICLAGGRAVFVPIYWGTYSRANDEFTSNCPIENPGYNKAIVLMAKDFSRSIDFLEADLELFDNDLIDADRLAYGGFCWSALHAPVVLGADELLNGLDENGMPRVKVAVLDGCGFFHATLPPEVDALTFVPHLHSRVLMLNGREDPFFPYESSQLPMFQLLPLYKAGKNLHTCLVGKGWLATDESRDHINEWLDRCLGKPKRKVFTLAASH